MRPVKLQKILNSVVATLEIRHAQHFVSILQLNLLFLILNMLPQQMWNFKGLKPPIFSFITEGGCLLILAIELSVKYI